MSYRKYHSTKITSADGVFDSKKEYKRWLELKQMQDEGTITNLQRQVSYELIPKQKLNNKVVERACTYKADFVYEYDGSLVVEDTKGFRTADYIIKRKLMLYTHGIRIREV